MSPKQLTQNQTVSVRSFCGEKISDERAPSQWPRFAKAEYLSPAEVALNILRDHQCSLSVVELEFHGRNLAPGRYAQRQ